MRIINGGAAADVGEGRRVKSYVLLNVFSVVGVTAAVGVAIVDSPREDVP